MRKEETTYPAFLLKPFIIILQSREEDYFQQELERLPILFVNIIKRMAIDSSCLILNGNLQGIRPNKSLRTFPGSGHMSKTLLLVLPVLTSVTQKRRIRAQVSGLSQEQLTDLNGRLIKTLPKLPVAKVVPKGSMALHS